MHRRRGGEARKRGINRRGVTPGIDQYPNLAAGFRRRALFFEKSPSAKSEHRQASPVISGSPLESSRDSGPYVSGTMGASDRNNHAYGISCRTRPIPIVRTRSDDVGTGTAWAVPFSTHEQQRLIGNDGLGQKSGLV